MKINAIVLSSLVLSLSLAGSLQAKAKEKWVCTKDAAEVEVKGKKPDDKKKDCEAKGGTWEKSEHAEAKEQSSGSGGAW